MQLRMLASVNYKYLVLFSPGIREAQLQKALQRVRPKLPSAASLAAATAAAEEAKQGALQRAISKLPSAASQATAMKSEEEAQQPSSHAPLGAAATVPNEASAPTDPTPMDGDTAPTVTQAQDSKTQPKPEVAAALQADAVKPEEEEAQKAESSKQAVAQLPVSELER